MAAAKLFSGPAGMRLVERLSTKGAAATLGEGGQPAVPGAAPGIHRPGVRSAADTDKIKEAIRAASSLEEMARLEALLKSGRSL